MERIFRSGRSVTLKVRPIRHRLVNRTCTRVFVCLLACYVEWRMRQSLAPMLFDDEDSNGPGQTLESGPGQGAPPAHCTWGAGA